MVALGFLFLIIPVLVVIDFVKYLSQGRRLFRPHLQKVIDIIAVIVIPLFYLSVFDEKTNNCCTDSATFSPEHRLTIYVMVGLCMAAYLVARLITRRLPPLLEVIVNALLVFGFILNLFIALQVVVIFSLVGNLPVGLLFLIALWEKHQAFLAYWEAHAFAPRNSFEILALKVLKARPLVKFPLLLLLCAPVFILISSSLLLFGQRPDSLVRAFTDTYKHGFSKWDYMCNNVECGGHFLCSVAAKGHQNIVHPIRYGERGGQRIICNRQLLVANAFEEVLEQYVPTLHRFIRKQYNKVGVKIHRHYHVFNRKWVADLIYFAMKPLELLFVTVLYLVDVHPENRIGRQYAGRK